MHRTVVLCALGALGALATVTTDLPAQQRFAGDWGGYWFRAGDSMAVTLHVRRDSSDAAVTVRVLPHADHTFRLPADASGWPTTAPDYLPTLLHWLGTVAQRARRDAIDWP